MLASTGRRASAQHELGDELGPAVLERFPGIAFTVCDVAVSGWPWRTRVAVRLGITATLVDGSRYENDAVQWITLRWGRMLDDWVLEDTLALEQACRTQAFVPA